MITLDKLGLSPYLLHVLRKHTFATRKTREMAMKYPQGALVLAALVLFLSAFSSSQTGTASLHGTISDPEGAVIPAATAILSNPATGFSRATKTDDNGFYQFRQVPPGTYTLTVSKTGFA